MYQHHSSQQVQKQYQDTIKFIMEQKQLPKQGISDAWIEKCILDLSLQDSNNFMNRMGVGEREGRIYNMNIVGKRNFYFSHGMGRSGNLLDQQPKAHGSNTIVSLCHSLVKSALKWSGMTHIKECLLFPCCTGMTMQTVLLNLKLMHPEKKYIIWSRIDQKSVLKAIQLIPGTEVVVVEPSIVSKNNSNNDDTISLILDWIALRNKIQELQPEHILCICTTTSCFAPRISDPIINVAELCKEYQIAHVINNAYGVQSRKVMQTIDQASLKGRVDVYIQSMDKNFMVPVGGCIIAANQKQSNSLLQQISGNYPGRAQFQSILDLFITLLSMGQEGWSSLLMKREENYKYLIQQLEEKICKKYQERILNKENPISLALSLDHLYHTFEDDKVAREKLKQIGSFLFYRNVTGSRVVTSSQEVSRIGKIELTNFGAHSSQFKGHYLTVAAAIGLEKEEIDQFIVVLDKVLMEVSKG